MLEFLVLNEVGHGRDPKAAGDVSVFASRQAIEEHLEPWFVDEPHMMLVHTGRRVELRATKWGVQVTESSDATDYSELARSWLLVFLYSVVQAREQRKSMTVGPIDFNPMSTVDLCRLSLIL